jgi:ParB-like nuclease domain
MTEIKRKPWRDVIAVHPAANLFPMMSESELRELGEDIKKNGLLTPIVIFEGKAGCSLLDGRNRLDAMELVGIPFELQFRRPKYRKDWGWFLAAREAQVLASNGIAPVRVETDDPYDYVISTNIRRRHLTSEQKRGLIAKIIKAKPEVSDRQIATQTVTSHPFVGKIRAELERRGDVEIVSTSLDTKGRKQPRTKANKAVVVPKLNTVVATEVGGPEVGDVETVSTSIDALYASRAAANILAKVGRDHAEIVLQEFKHAQGFYALVVDRLEHLLLSSITSAENAATPVMDQSDARVTELPAREPIKPALPEFPDLPAFLDKRPVKMEVH